MKKMISKMPWKIIALIIFNLRLFSDGQDLKLDTPLRDLEKNLDPPVLFNFPRVRAPALYSTVDGSRQGYSWLVGKKKIKNKKCLQAHVGGGKK